MYTNKQLYYTLIVYYLHYILGEFNMIRVEALSKSYKITNKGLKFLNCYKKI